MSAQPTSPQQTTMNIQLNATPNTLSSDISDGSLPSTPTSPGDELLGLMSDKKKNINKRGIFPKHATNVMKAWLFQHLVVSVFVMHEIFTFSVN